MQLILLIIDGFGVEHLGWMLQYKEVRALFKQFDSSAYVVNTPPTEHKLLDERLDTSGLAAVTESASSASAISTGRWHHRKGISSTHDGKKLETLGDFAHKHGKHCGAVTTTFLSDATIAAFFSHAIRRDEYESIQKQLDTSPALEIAIGCSGPTPFTVHYERELIRGAKRIAPHRGLFPLRDRKTTVSDCVKFLWDELGEDRFIVAEEGLVDVYCHEKDLNKASHEMRGCIDTITTCMKLAASTDDTLLLVTADHSTGAPKIINNRSNTHSSVELTYNDHNSFLVPLFAYGESAEEFSGLLSTIELSHLMRKHLKK